MTYNPHAVKSFYRRVLAIFLTIHPSKDNKFYISKQEGNKRRRVQIPFIFSQKAINECKSRMKWAKDGDMLYDICMVLGLEYNNARKRIYQKNKRWIT